MNIVFLRGSIPPASEHPEKLYYDRMNDCEDVWTQFFYFLVKKLNANGELLYQGGSREQKVCGVFTETWVPSFSKYNFNYYPDIIFARGGFSYYDSILKKYPKSKKIYYGAGKRFFPKTDFIDYDIFLVDSKKQKNKICNKGFRSELFIKPAATLFNPIDVQKAYDVCFIANASQCKIKRHELLLRSFSNSKFRILNIGNKDKRLIRLAKKFNVNIDWAGWSLRKHLPEKISKCSVGVCCSSNYDSCPRVIPEYLACGLPIIVTNNINFWKEKYITPYTGVCVKENGICGGVKKVINQGLDVKNYYDSNLDIDCASSHLCQIIESIL